MNIHEHQAKQILEKYGAPVPKGVYGLSVSEALEKAKNSQNKKICFKSTNSCWRQRKSWRSKNT